MAKNIYRRLTPEQIKEILSITESKQVTRTLINSWFSPQVLNLPDGKTKIGAPKFYVTDEFDLPANTLKNQKTIVKDTTIGIYLFNFFILSEVFGARILYVNETLSKSHVSKIEKEIVENIIMKHVTPEQFAEYERRVTWLSYFTELFMPGLTYEFINPNDKVLEMKKKLLKENPDILKNNDAVAFHNKIEKPLLKYAEELLQDDPAWPIYELGVKPSFSNNYKNSNITNGALFDPISQKFIINDRAYSEGHDIKKYDVLANKAVAGSYSRGVETQDGGYMSKIITPALSTVELDEHGTDCGTKLYRSVTLTNANINSFKMNYMIEDDGSLKLLTYDIMKNYIGKTVKMRSPLYCRSKKMCNKCFGELVYIQEFFNAGSLASRTTATIMNRSMKGMHDITIKTTKIDLKKFTKFS